MTARRLAITGALHNLLHQARQRHSLNLVLEYLAVAGGIGAAGVILLLVLGRQILDWYWPVLLFVGALATGLYRARKRMLSGYRLAQVVDARLGLEDRLSTLAWSEEAGASPEFLRVVAQQAEERVRPGDAVRAMPVAFPRYGYVCAGLLMAAAGMFGLRYGMLHTMDLNPPIADIRFEPLQPEPKAYAATKKSAIQERWEQQLKELGLTPQDLEMPDEKGLKPIEQEIPAAGNDPKAAAEKQEGVKNMKAPSEEGEAAEEGGEKSEQGDKADNSNPSDSNSQDQKGQPSKKQNDAPQNAKQGQQGSQDGLLNKMRDAMANLMNKLKNNNQDQQQQSAQGNPSQQQGQQGKQQQQQQQGMQQQGKQQGEGQPSADQDGQQQAGQQQAGDKSKSGDKNGERPGDQNAKSGMGQQDGDKALREARQLEAMGKISELFGKRAQQVTGEMSVEVSSGKQQLKTQWSERKALHSDTGAETNRNEIPLAYQSYIQRYFEEVRKAPGAKSKAPANP